MRVKNTSSRLGRASDSSVTAMPACASRATVAVMASSPLTAALTLRAAGIAVEEFSLHLPSLDEVFFTLTGTRSHDDSAEALV